MLPRPNSRRQLALNEPVEPFTRLAICGFGPSPAGGFGSLVTLLTHFDHDGLPCVHGKILPLAPIPKKTLHVYGIESEDYSEDRDYFQKPPSNVAGHSRGTTLYGTLT